MELEKKSFTYSSKENAPKRLDLALKEEFKDFSRHFLADLIKTGMVAVASKKVTKPSFKVLSGDSVNVSFLKKPCPNLKPIKMDLKIELLEKDFLVVNKPSGILTHPASTAPEEISLANGLLEKFPELEKIKTSYKEGQKESFYSLSRPGIVHRLDKQTSGLLIVARTQKGFKKFSEIFSKRKIEKKYLAIVLGDAPEKGSISKPIGRHPVHGNKMSIGGVSQKEAFTAFKKLKTFSLKDVFEEKAKIPEVFKFDLKEVKKSLDKKENLVFSLLEVEILTGRTHQIRVHMASIGHPILADELYSKESLLLSEKVFVKDKSEKIKKISRQALDAFKLKFEYEEKKIEIKKAS